MKLFRFLDFSVYVRSKILYNKVVCLTKSFRDFSLKDQVRRASLSVVLNIAEGSAKKSDKDFARFLQNSLGSINEVYACLDLMKELNLVDKKQFDLLSKDCRDITMQLGGFFKKLTKS